MEHYANAPDASMHMHEDPALLFHLERLILGTYPFTKEGWVPNRLTTCREPAEIAVSGPIQVVIETGTYNGTGSTRFVAEAFARTRLPAAFHTIEVNHQSVRQAKANLKCFPFVACHWGSSVELEGAIRWMEHDEMLLNQDRYTGIWTDHVTNPVQGYSVEMQSSLTLRDSPEWEGEGLLKKLLEQHRHEQPLVILDSAGGIGWLEFQIMMDTMGAHRYYVLLDDVGHVKHVRSYRHMSMESSGFCVLAQQGKWALAVH